MGTLNKKTLQPRNRYINVIDEELLKADWRNNSINDKSLKCVDMSFFEDEEFGTNLRHGVYAFSSRDWDNIK